MANPVVPVPLLPNPTKNPDVGYLQVLARSAVAILIDHARRLNAALMADGSEPMTGPLALAQYATADLPAAAANEGAIVYDSTTNTVKFSNGAAWASM